MESSGQGTHFATLVGWRYRLFPLLGRWGVLVLGKDRTVTLYGQGDRVVFQSPVSSVACRKLTLDGFQVRVDGQAFDLYGVDAGLIRAQGKRRRLLEQMDHHGTTDELPGLSVEEQRSRSGTASRSRRRLWATLWVELLVRAGAQQMG